MSILGKNFDREFDQAWGRMFERDNRDSRAPAHAAHTAFPLQLEQVVRAAIRDLRKELGRAWLPNSNFGTRLHAKVAEHIRSLSNPAGWWIAAEMPLRQYGTIPHALLAKSLDSFLSGEGRHLDWIRNDLPAKTLTEQIGNIKPDLVIRGPDQVTTVWDLTSRERQEHVAKTILYANLLAQDNHLTRIGETYWLKF